MKKTSSFFLWFLSGELCDTIKKSEVTCMTRILATDKLIKVDPMNLKITLTNDFNNDILIRVMLEITKLENTMIKGKDGK